MKTEIDIRKIENRLSSDDYWRVMSVKSTIITILLGPFIYALHWLVGRKFTDRFRPAFDPKKDVKIRDKQARGEK